MSFSSWNMPKHSTEKNDYILDIFSWTSWWCCLSFHPIFHWSWYCQPKQCTIMRGNPQTCHTCAFFDPLNNGNFNDRRSFSQWLLQTSISEAGIDSGLCTASTLPWGAGSCRGFTNGEFHGGRGTLPLFQIENKETILGLQEWSTCLCRHVGNQLVLRLIGHAAADILLERGDVYLVMHVLNCLIIMTRNYTPCKIQSGP